MRRARRRLSSNNPHVTPLNSDSLISNEVTKDIEGKFQYGYCPICGRKLKSEDSKKKGGGRVCRAKTSNQNQLFQ